MKDGKKMDTLPLGVNKILYNIEDSKELKIFVTKLFNYSKNVSYQSIHVEVMVI